MKKLLPLLLPGLLAFASDAPAPQDYLGVAGPLAFHKTVFKLAWAARPATSFYTQEYLPMGERLTDFKQMLTLSLSDQDTDVQRAVGRKVRELEIRKQNDPTCHYQVLSNPASQEVILDFLLSQDLAGAAGIVEFNVYRYQPATLGPNKPGVLLYAYSKRGYGNGIEEFLKGLPGFRPVAINEMAATTMPIVKLRQP